MWRRIQLFIGRHKKDLLLALALLAIAGVPRLVGLGTFLTADEKTWIERSREFVRAFHDVRINDMLQTTHPGVPTLWTAGLAITVKGALSHVQLADETLPYFIKTAQFSIAFLNTCIIPLVFLFSLRVWGDRTFAFLAALFLALDPFIIGYSRVVHVDALMAGLLTLAVLASIVYARTLKKNWLMGSALLSSLAILTKFPAVFIMPFIIISLLVYYTYSSREQGFLKKRFRDALYWIFVVGIILIILFPALLFVPNPKGNVLQFKRDIAIAATTPHDMSQEYSLNAWHYPAALLTRTNPVVMIGVVLACIAIVYQYRLKTLSRETILLFVYAFGFLFMMTLGAKKGDRYIMPIFFALDMIAAYGILLFANKRGRRVVISTSLLSTVYLVFVIFSTHPYAIAYSNPLFPDNLSQELGWGEGLDIVANWLNENHPNATVASWYPQELGAFTTAKVLHINAHQQNQVGFVVLYKNMFGRAPDHYANDFIDEYYKKRTPVFIARVAGKEFAWVYEKPVYTKTVGDLENEVIVAQDVEVQHEGLLAVDILPATHFGKSVTGTLTITIGVPGAIAPIHIEHVPVFFLKDNEWYRIVFPDRSGISKNTPLRIQARVLGAKTPFPSLRRSDEEVHNGHLLISRTGTVQGLEQKPGALAVRLVYEGTDGKPALDLEDKLLR